MNAAGTENRERRGRSLEVGRDLLGREMLLDLVLHVRPNRRQGGVGAGGLSLLPELRRRAQQLFLAARRIVSVLRLERSQSTTLQRLPKVRLSKASTVERP